MLHPPGTRSVQSNLLDNLTVLHRSFQDRKSKRVAHVGTKPMDLRNTYMCSVDVLDTCTCLNQGSSQSFQIVYAALQQQLEENRGLERLIISWPLYAGCDSQSKRFLRAPNLKLILHTECGKTGRRRRQAHSGSRSQGSAAG